MENIMKSKELLGWERTCVTSLKTIAVTSFEDDNNNFNFICIAKKMRGLIMSRADAVVRQGRFQQSWRAWPVAGIWAPKQ